MEYGMKSNRKEATRALVLVLAIGLLALPAWGMDPVTLAGGGHTVPFPSTEVGQHSDVTVTLNMNAPLVLSDVSVTGDYAVTSSNCNPPVAVAPGDSCVMAITFSPKAKGNRWSSLVFTADTGAKFAFGFAGVGTGPVLTFTPGLVSTIAGTGAGGYSGDGGPATSAEFNYPMGLARDSVGNLYVADIVNNVVRKVSVDGTVSTVAGDGVQGYGGDGGPATSAQLAWPTSIALDPAGNLYIADFLNSCVRKVDLNGVISTLAMGSLVRGVAADNNGNVYFSSWTEGVWKVDSSGVTTRIAGTGIPGFSGDGGPATSAQTSAVAGLAVDGNGNVYLAEVWNSVVRRIDAAGTISSVTNNQAGLSGEGGPAIEAHVNGPYDIKLDAAGNLYILDSGNNRIRKVNGDGKITTIAGRDYGYSGDGGSAFLATFGGPVGLVLDEKGNIYVGDTANNVIRKITVDLTTIDFGTVTVGQTAGPVPVVVSNAGNADLNISNVVASSSFSALSQCADGPLAPAADCSIDISFNPNSAGPITGTVTVTNDAIGNPHVINLTGEATAAATDLLLVAPFGVLPLNSNLGVVAVSALDANGHLVSDFTGTVTLNLVGPQGFATYSGQANAAGGMASFDMTSVILNVAGSYTITVSSPGLNPMQVTFTVVGNADFAIATSSDTLSLTGKGTGSVNVTVTPQNGFSGTIALRCSGLPARSTCSLVPASVTSDGSDTPLSSILTISTGVTSVASTQAGPKVNYLAATSAGFGLGLAGLVFAPLGRKNRPDRRARLLQFVLIAVILAGLAGCGTLGGQVGSDPTPPGTYRVTVTASTTQVSHSVVVNLVVR